MSVQLAQVKAKARSAFRRLLWGIVILLLLIGLGFFIYSQLTYSDGYRSGQLVKISRRGVIFKTYEGTLNLSPEGMMTTWDFSVKDGAIANQLETFDGKRVKVHYIQRYRTFFWQGETEYVVDEVTNPGAQ